MKKFISQITAFALAICMLAALVPAMPAQAADGDVVLNFCTESIITGEKLLKDVTFKDGGNWEYNESHCSGAMADAVKNTEYTSYTYKYRNNLGAMYVDLRYSRYNLTLNVQVEKEGYYVLSEVDAFGVGAENSDVTNIEAGPWGGPYVKVGSIDLSDVTSTNEDEVEITGGEKVYLNAGTNMIRLSGAETQTYNSVALKKIVFSPVPEEPVVSDTVEMNFNLSDKVGTIITAVGDHNGNWKYSAEKSHQYIQDGINNGQYKILSLPDGVGLKLDMQPWLGNLALAFEVADAGWYQLSGDIYGTFGYSNSVNISVDNGEKEFLLGTVDGYVAEGTQLAYMPEFKKVYLNKGTNYLILKGLGYSVEFKKAEGEEAQINLIYLQKLVFKKTDAPSEYASSDIFGTDYAYVKKNASGTYDVSFIGGVNIVEGYGKVGFEISVNGAAAVDVEDSSVYETLTVNKSHYKAAYYGADYIFISTKANVSEGDTITAKPYVKDAAGNKIYHGNAVVLTLEV